MFSGCLSPKKTAPCLKARTRGVFCHLAHAKKDVLLAAEEGMLSVIEIKAAQVTHPQLGGL